MGLLFFVCIFDESRDRILDEMTKDQNLIKRC